MSIQFYEGRIIYKIHKTSTCKYVHKRKILIFYLRHFVLLIKYYVYVNENLIKLIFTFSVTIY